MPTAGYIRPKAQIFELAGKLAGNFFCSAEESPIYAQIPQLFFWSREFAGNLQGISSFQRNSFRTGLLRRELG
jgi:hypothetical protein